MREMLCVIQYNFAKQLTVTVLNEVLAVCAPVAKL